ncbi:branched-chain amino acid transporter AzlC, partial [Priestia megaterium]|nr:branched-chain amino acid transporter AzlC [Priestia megaterium]
IEQWRKEKKHHSALAGLGLSAISLIIFGGNHFIIPAMLMILTILTFLKKPLEKAEVTA